MKNAMGKLGLKMKKHSPEIFIIVGIVGTVASAVMACKATLKATDILENARTGLDNVNDCLANESLKDDYTTSDAKKDRVLIYAQTGVKLFTLYSPAILLGAMSLASIITSNGILRKRNASLAAAYAAVDKSFKEFRARVIERYGKDVERDIRYNIKAKTFEETTIDENGKEKKTKKIVNIASPDVYSDYARYFDESCPDWQKVPEYNLIFLKAQQNYANDVLKAKGFLFLNDVYKMLGIPESKAGQIVGWVYKFEGSEGDNYVDFGIYNFEREIVRDFVNGYEPVILLDFNVDGNIWDLMD